MRGIKGTTFRLVVALVPILALAASAAVGQAPGRLEVLRPTGGLPAHIAASFQEPLGFAQAQSGAYFVFDRRAHAVYRIDAGSDAATRIVEIGHEEGRVIEPTRFALEPGGTFVVADAPRMVERIQIFGSSGARLGGFTLPGRASARVLADGLVLSGIGSLQYTGRSILINQPETGALMTEYGLGGTPVRTIGRLRATGFEHDRDLHLAFNTGVPLIDPNGGYYFVFQAGRPLLRKYTQAGQLVFERHLEGRELDPLIQGLPTTWPRREIAGEELPLVAPLVRTAAVDPAGRVWVSFVVPVTYVYDSTGEKVRTVQFRGAGPVTPASLSFAGRNRLLVAPGCYEFAVE